MEKGIHAFASILQDLVGIFVNLHLLAVLFVNVTTSPSEPVEESSNFVDAKRLYRLIEIFAGLITPYSKR